MHPLWFFGGGGHAKVVYGSIPASLSLKGVFVQAPSQACLDVPYIVQESPAHDPMARYHIPIGRNKARQEIAAQNPRCTWQTICHPTAIVASSAKIAPGCFIGPGAIINPDAEIGAHTIINSGAIIEHDTKIGAYCHIAPGAVITGSCAIEQGTLVGANATILPNIAVGAWSIIGAGATLTHDIADGACVVGTPARPLKA